MTIVHDTAPSAPPKIGQIVSILKITEGRRQEAGGRRQEAGGRRQEAGGRRQEACSELLLGKISKEKFTYLTDLV